jgi:uncharacterized protein
MSYIRTLPSIKKSAAIEKVKRIIEDFQIEVIAIGNGTASRETEQFIADLLKDIDRKVYYLIVNEAGASVYSASELAREEFPDLQVEERRGVSIARRLQDPLAELVKIDPKSVGVGQYQHDVEPEKTKRLAPLRGGNRRQQSRRQREYGVSRALAICSRTIENSRGQHRQKAG